MPDFNIDKLLSNLKQIASTKTGFVMLIILAITGIPILWVFIVTWAERANPLEGAIETIFRADVLIFVISIAVLFVKSLIKSEKVATNGIQETNEMGGAIRQSISPNTKKPASLKNKFDKIVLFVVLIWMVMIGIMAYITMWVMAWQVAIQPLINKLITLGFDWSYKSLSDFVTTFVIFSLLLVTPILIYAQVTNLFGENNKKAKRLRNQQRRGK